MEDDEDRSGDKGMRKASNGLLQEKEGTRCNSILTYVLNKNGKRELFCSAPVTIISDAIGEQITGWRGSKIELLRKYSFSQGKAEALIKDQLKP